MHRRKIRRAMDWSYFDELFQEVKMMKDAKPVKKKYRPLIRFLVKTCAIAGTLSAILAWVLCLCRMSGNQMFPSVRDGDLCVFYRLEECYPGDIVLYEDKAGNRKLGRVAAMGGQSVEVAEEGGLEVNGCRTIDEIPYETYAARESPVAYPVTLAQDTYFILNDFRSDTDDSRQNGPVDKGQIKGKLLFLFRRRGF